MNCSRINRGPAWSQRGTLTSLARMPMSARCTAESALRRGNVCALCDMLLDASERSMSTISHPMRAMSMTACDGGTPMVRAPVATRTCSARVG